MGNVKQSCFDGSTLGITELELSFPEHPECVLTNSAINHDKLQLSPVSRNPPSPTFKKDGHLVHAQLLPGKGGVANRNAALPCLRGDLSVMKDQLRRCFDRVQIIWRVEATPCPVNRCLS